MDNLQSQQSVALPTARSPEGTAPSIIQTVEHRQSATQKSGRVFPSVDNIFYLTGGSNEVSSLYTEEGMPTDNHWTWQGAFSAFQILMSGFHRSSEYKSLVALPKVALRYCGDLCESHFTDIGPVPLRRVTLPSSIRRVYTNQMVGPKGKGGTQSEQGLHMSSHCTFAKPSEEFQETDILLGSSFSECRPRPSLLTNIFVDDFATDHSIWSTPVDFHYVERHKPVITFAELPQRFLTFPPADTSSAEETSVDKIRAWRQSNGT